MQLAHTLLPSAYLMMHDVFTQRIDNHLATLQNELMVVCDSCRPESRMCRPAETTDPLALGA